MSLFLWDSLKAETLRTICKDLKINLGTKRKREDMVAILKKLETQGVSSTLQDDESTGKVLTSHPPVNNLKNTTSKPISKPPSHDQSDDNEEMDTGDIKVQQKFVGPRAARPKCPCADGWLSPRMRFILSTVAAVASDLVLDTGEFAVHAGHVGAVHMTQYIPVEELPQGKSVALWLKGFSNLFRVIHEIFEAGRIPTEPVLLETLQLPKSKRDQKLVSAFEKHTKFEHALSGLVQQAKKEWEDDFQDVHCDEEWDELLGCAEHDFAWTVVEDLLAD